ncbi:hypothetical protein [Campylobacter pinnipediorum]|uniref:hypothetical protein n=1 Tax=Campylobacter pinnipediorum TaxID=1965231 RepID=UPI00099503DB|nr:hypothetical protein [Campylobacter pinnipediorum]AQW83037.1 hypothetical protein CPIN17261_1033 [Campylobacter pinnipediorum subsp. pinnipediorum]
MTKEQFNDIQERLKVYRKERGLTYENQSNGLMANILEELAEYLRAGDDNERIDALCDMAVFILNSFELKKYEIEEILYFLCDEDECFINSTFVNDIFELVDNYITFGKRDNKYLGRSLFILFLGIKDKNYDIYKCMLETIKEISSRTGYYDEIQKKFIKDKNQLNEYKADYESCKKEIR